MQQRLKVSRWCWKDGTERLGRQRVATDLQFLKNKVSAKCNKTKYSKTKYAYTVLK